MRNLLRLFLAAALTIAAGVADAAPKSVLWERWTAHDPASSVTIDHGEWDAWLKRFVDVGEDGIALVAYNEVSPRAYMRLGELIERLQATPVSTLNRDEQRAFWINLYNASTVALIVQYGPVRSIKDIDISPGLFTDGPWDKKLLIVEGETISLNDIEHRILRPIWRDPRIHYAVNCAALGCPNLWPEAVTAANAEAYLDRGAAAYVNHPRGAQVENGRLKVSSIYEWFKEDFSGTDAGVIEHLKRYAANDLAERLAGITKISDDSYDWALNGSPARKDVTKRGS